MTNKDKYLKDGVDVEELRKEFEDWYAITRRANTPANYLVEFLNETVKPTLSEDEKVILRNIDKKIKYITRDKSGYLYITEQSFSMLALSFSIYNHLFQFIQLGEEYKISDLLEE